MYFAAPPIYSSESFLEIGHKKKKTAASIYKDLVVLSLVVLFLVCNLPTRPSADYFATKFIHFTHGNGEAPNVFSFSQDFQNFPKT